MRESRDPHKLRFIWKAWRDATGAKMRHDYIRYIELKNKAAKLNGILSLFEQKNNVSFINL